jgi:hypothetical protein
MKGIRQYLGFVLADKIYIGKKTINWVISDEQGRKLAELISDASEQREKFDLKIVLKPRKDGRFTLTVTYA